MNASKASSVLGGKTARACDSCLLKRARWFCVADDAFLCQACDNSVHSANPLASRHERVRLETSSCKVKDSNPTSPAPAWHQGFTRKARTPRQAKAGPRAPPPNQFPLVPEINSCEDTFPEENDEQLFCRVPVFYDFDDAPMDLNQEIVADIMLDDDGDLNLEELLGNYDAEFTADVEGMNIGLADERNGFDEFVDGKRVKMEGKNDDDDDDEEVKAVIACHLDPSLDMELNWDFDYGSSSMNNGEEVAASKNDVGSNERMLLRLNYEAVIAAWSTQGSPWTDGIKPQFNLDQFMAACLGGSSDEWGGVGPRLRNVGREARVSRYREKRRTRLFSKKIRYEVRKLNAEKRPRMKGRFVKRTAFSGSSLPNYHLINK